MKLKKRTKSILLAFFLVSLIIMVVTYCSAEIVITGHDVIVHAGTKAVLSAKAEKKFISFLSPDIRGLEVTFLYKELVIGTAVTDKYGIARVEYLAVNQAGVYPITYQIPKKKMYYRAGRLFVVDGSRPALVTDIDGTISDYPDWKVPLGGSTAPTFANASEVLRKLAQSYDLIYLTARDDAMDKVTMAFLDKHRFPEGPVLYNDLGLSKEKRKQLSPKHHGAFKCAVIKKTLAAGIPIVAGIGNASTDAEAYLGAGIDAYLIKDPKYVISAPAVVFQDYAEFEQILAKKDAEYKNFVQQRKKTGK
jgi:phosphatidate phosphatase PAH1